MGSRRAGCDRDSNWFGEFLGLCRVAEERVDCWCGVEVGYVFLFQQSPDLGVVDLAEAVMRSSDGCDGPGECPAWKLSVVSIS